jgi:dolichol-phosphate mannosyltransferase
MLGNEKLRIDLVIPVYNEAEVVDHTHARLVETLSKLNQDFCIIYVNDGSTDNTLHVLEELSIKDTRIKVVSLSRNFGHQAALTAGMDAATGKAVVTLDGDGQHPPEMIPQMIDLLKQGYDIVQTQRMDEAVPASFKKWASATFYRVMNILSGTQVVPGSADFRALSRDALDALKSMPEYHRFLRGMVSWIGYKTVILPYQPADRLLGKTKYSMRKRLRLAMDAIFSFSLVPLYIGISLGALMICLALLEMLYVLSFWLTGQTSNLAPGWSSLMFVVLIVGGLLMAMMGFIGIYVGFIFQEVKRRPVYLIKKGERHEGG